MNPKRLFPMLAAMALAFVVSGCATKPPVDYTAYRESRPKSILVLPPLNETPDVQATNSVYSYVTVPLAEAGYYVLPVTLVAETFKENGLTQPADMHATAPDKLRKIFGADAALYINISRYGTVYQVINSESAVAANGKLVDLKTGATLWTGSAFASSAENNNQQQGGLAGLLVAAIVKQVLATTFDQSHQIAGVATGRLLAVGPKGGLLFGPRSPNYGKD